MAVACQRCDRHDQTLCADCFSAGLRLDVSAAGDGHFSPESGKMAGDLAVARVANVGRSGAHRAVWQLQSGADGGFGAIATAEIITAEPINFVTGTDWPDQEAHKNANFAKLLHAKARKVKSAF